MKLPDKFKESKKSMSFRDRTPLHKGMTVVCADVSAKGEVHYNEPIEVRFYWGSGMTCYCVVWLRSEMYGYAVGIGKAYGSGYHHESAALGIALRDLGIQMENSERIDGVGDGAMIDALCALSRLLGYDNPYIVDFHR